MMFKDWKETVRAIYDELHFGRDSIFEGDGRELARRLVTLIEERHPDYFVEAAPTQRIGEKEER